MPMGTYEELWGPMQANGDMGTYGDPWGPKGPMRTYGALR